LHELGNRDCDDVAAGVKPHRIGNFLVRKPVLRDDDGFFGCIGGKVVKTVEVAMVYIKRVVFKGKM